MFKRKLWKTVNRTMIIIEGRTPLVDWLNGLPDQEITFTLKDVNDENTALLVPEDCADPEYGMDWLHAFKKELFENELEAWSTDRTLWPKNRNEKTFDKWFSLKIHSIVHDLSSEPLKREYL